MLLGANNELLFTEIFTHSNSIQATLETGKLVWPFGAFLGFNQKVYQFFTWCGGSRVDGHLDRSGESSEDDFSIQPLFRCINVPLI